VLRSASITRVTINLSAAKQLGDELDFLYSGGSFQLDGQGCISLTKAQYALFAVKHASMPTSSGSGVTVDPLHFAGQVSYGLYYGNGLVQQMASGLLPRLQKLVAPYQNMSSLNRYYMETLVQYLGKMVVVEKHGEITSGRSKGAFHIPYREPDTYLLRISGVKDREIPVSMSSLADGTTVVELDDKN
jgi:hypothetical protein